MIAYTSPLSIINGSVATTTDYDVIIHAQLLDALTTNQGERVMHPTWGCNIQNLLYDPSSSLERQDAASYIRNLLVHMVPRVIVQTVTLDVSDEEPNIVYIRIVYQASSFSPTAAITVPVDTTNTAGATP